MNSSRLKSILEIGDQKKRQGELADFAKSLKVNVLKARRGDGQIDEDELTVLIYDAIQNKIRAKNQILGVIVGGLIFIFMLGAVMFLFGNFLAPGIQNTVLERNDVEQTE